jgi:hypothetical protein
MRAIVASEVGPALDARLSLPASFFPSCLSSFPPHLPKLLDGAHRVVGVLWVDAALGEGLQRPASLWQELSGGDLEEAVGLGEEAREVDGGRAWEG